MVRRVLAWAQKNERHLGAAVFVLGFLTDLVALILLEVTVVLAVAGVYLLLAALAVFLGHLAAPWRNHARVWRRSVTVLLPLAAQYLIGNLLSWFLIFYTKSSVLETSWPFLILLALVFLGNEWFRKYKDRLAFVAVLLFFVSYAYAIFALPLLLGRLGPEVFLLSTAVAVAGLFGYLFFLGVLSRPRRIGSLPQIIGASLAIVIVIVTSYFTGLIPPIPLSLKEGGVYHALLRTDVGYVVEGEIERSWWDPRPDTVHVGSGTTLYAFSSVAAPARFGAVVVHRWQRYDSDARAWVTTSRIAFPISGGRVEGYRGYSESSVTPGAWRVRVETENGQVIGQLRFEAVTGAPVLRQEVK